MKILYRTFRIYVVVRIRKLLFVSIMMMLQSWSLAAVAHEFWLEPVDFQLAENTPLSITLRNGQGFDGDVFPYIPAAFNQFTLTDKHGTRPVQGQMDDLIAVIHEPVSPGLLIVQYESVENLLVYESFDKFAEFATNEGQRWALNLQQAENDEHKLIREIYTRYAKALVNAGHPVGQDQRTVMELELVVLDNPYASPGQGPIRVQVFYQGKTLSDAQISVYTKNGPKPNARTITQTDARGEALIRTIPGTQYLLNVVHVRRPSLSKRLLDRVSWESLWASLTFETVYDDPL